MKHAIPLSLVAAAIMALTGCNTPAPVTPPAPQPEERPISQPIITQKGALLSSDGLTQQQVAPGAPGDALVANPSAATGLGYAARELPLTFQGILVRNGNTITAPNAVDQTATYNDPAWIKTLSASKIIGLPVPVAQMAVGTSAGTVAAGDDTRIVNAVQQTGAYADPSFVASLSASKLLTDKWTLPASSLPDFSGDVSGSNALLTLATITTPGSSPVVTYDAKGRVLSGRALRVSDLPALASANLADSNTLIRATDPSSRLIAILGPPYGSLSGNGASLATVAGPVIAGHVPVFGRDGSLSDSGVTPATAPDLATMPYKATGQGGNTTTQQAANMRLIYFCRDWGVCDGKTDDTAQWALAVAAVSGNAPEIIIPMGAKTVLNAPAWKANLSLVCGPGATIKKSSASANYSMLSWTFVPGPQIHNCILDQNGVAQTGGNNAMVYVQSAAGFVIDNVTLVNSGAPSPVTRGILAYANNGGIIKNSTIGPSILGPDIIVDNGSVAQISTRAAILLGDNSLDNLLWVRAADAGSAGNAKTVSIVNDGPNQPLSFTGTSSALTVHLATDATGSSTSAAHSIIEAFQGAPLQQYFRVITRDTATGIVQPHAAANLAGGVDAFDTITVRNNLLTGSQSQGIEVQTSGGAPGDYCNVVVEDNVIRDVGDWTNYLATFTAHSGQNGNGIDISNCAGVKARNNETYDTDFSGIRVYNGWDNTVEGNKIHRSHENGMYDEFNSQGNIFRHNEVDDSQGGINDANSEQRTNKRPNKIEDNWFRRIAGTAIACAACIAKGNTIENSLIGIGLTGGGAGYDSQIIDNTCIAPMLECVAIDSAYGGTSALISSNQMVGQTTNGVIWGYGDADARILNVALGNPTVITYSNGTGLANGYTVTFHGIDIDSTNQLNGQSYVIANLTASTFTIPVDSTAFTPWIASTTMGNPATANGERFAGFHYTAKPAFSPSQFNRHVRVINQTFPDAVKGTPANGSFGFIPNDDCSAAGALTNIGIGLGAWAFYNNAWTCHVAP